MVLNINIKGFFAENYQVELYIGIYVYKLYSYLKGAQSLWGSVYRRHLCTFHSNWTN